MNIIYRGVHIPYFKTTGPLDFWDVKTGKVCFTFIDETSLKDRIYFKKVKEKTMEGNVGLGEKEKDILIKRLREDNSCLKEELKYAYELIDNSVSKIILNNMKESIKEELNTISIWNQSYQHNKCEGKLELINKLLEEEK